MKKTVLESFIESKSKSKSEFANDCGVKQAILSNDLKSANSLKMTFKYAKKLGLETLDFEGIEHGMYIKGTAKIN